MPTYEYRCPKGHEFELFQRMSDEPKAKCPTCGAKAKRMLSAGAGFLFKGGGFYITDYRSDTYQKAAKAEQEKSTSSPASSTPGDGSSGGSASAGGESTSAPKKAKSADKAGRSGGTKKKTGGSSSSGSASG